MKLQQIYFSFLWKIKKKIFFLNFIDQQLFLSCLSEFIGTLILMIIGLGTMLHNTTNDSNDISIGWSIGYILSQIITNPIGYNSIMNPSITMALAIIHQLPFHYIIPFTMIQFSSSLLSSLIIYFIYYKNMINTTTTTNTTTTNFATTNYTTEFDYSNIILLNQFITTPSVSHYICFIDRLLLSMITIIFILIIRDKRRNNNNNHNKIKKNYQIIYIALYTIGRISSLSMNAGTSINPIRDLGPRIIIASFELGLDAFKKDHYYFWIPIVAPYIGSIIGALLYELLIGAYLNQKKKRRKEEKKKEKKEKKGEKRKTRKPSYPINIKKLCP
uniref:Aquaporin n=1 Tax=Schistosoma mansoni TaxID=6183 RepID=A0A3Q0KKU8_SCHMA